MDWTGLRMKAHDHGEHHSAVVVQEMKLEYNTTTEGTILLGLYVQR